MAHHKELLFQINFDVYVRVFRHLVFLCSVKFGHKYIMMQVYATLPFRETYVLLRMYNLLSN
jgi:hypothetical protein